MYPSHISVQLSSQYTEYRGVTNTHHTDKQHSPKHNTSQFKSFWNEYKRKNYI